MEAVIILAGVALAISPWLLEFAAFSTAATTFSAIVGGIIAVAGIYALVRKSDRRWADAVALVASLFAVLVPGASSFPASAQAANIFLGLIAMFFAGYEVFFAKPARPAATPRRA